MGRTYRWGIIGAGIIARKLVGALRASGEAVPAFVASRNAERAEAFARECGVESFGSYEELLARSDLDAVYVATTHNFHRDNVRMVLERGLPVLVEKPFTVNAEEADDLISLARERGLFLMEAMWTRFLPATEKLRAAVADGAIGVPRYLDVSFGNFALPQYEGRLRDPALAGGVTLDMGIYPISFASRILGELPTEIGALARMGGSGVDEFAAIQLGYPSGAVAQIATSFALKMENRAMLYGSEGYLSFPAFPAGNSFDVYRHRGTNEVGPGETVCADHEENGFVYQVREVHRCLSAGLTESPAMPLDETRALMAVMDGMRRRWGLRYPFES
jgi:predicted dehydrogenase